MKIVTDDANVEEFELGFAGQATKIVLGTLAAFVASKIVENAFVSLAEKRHENASED